MGALLPRVDGGGVSEPLFEPKLGEVGSWTRLPDGTVGQVWSLSKSGRRATVWVADGARYTDVAVTDLADPVDRADDVAMFDLGDV